jgi:hypothetical protein
MWELSGSFIEGITSLSLKYSGIPYIKDDVKDAKEVFK